LKFESRIRSKKSNTRRKVRNKSTGISTSSNISDNSSSICNGGYSSKNNNKEINNIKINNNTSSNNSNNINIIINIIIINIKINNILREKLNYITRHLDTDLNHVAMRALSNLYNRNTNKTGIPGTVR